MSGLQRLSLKSLVADGGRASKPTVGTQLWNLNLDQIESDTGRILTKQMVAVEKLGSSTYPFEAGTVLYSKLRPYLNKVVVADDAGVATTELVPLRCNPEKLLPKYLAYYLRSKEFLSFANTVVAGAKMPRMVMSQFWEYQIPVLPLPEQRRIAAILDQADALRSKRREALALLDSLTQSIFIEMFGDPGKNQHQWHTTKLETVAIKITDGEHQTPRRTESGIKLLSARNVRDGYLDFGDDDYIDEAEYVRIAKRCNPERGDILISCSGSIGRVATVKTDERLGMVRSAALVKPDTDKVKSNFLEAYLRTPSLNRLMIRSANSSSQANLFQGPIRALPVFVPPLELQESFAKMVNVVDGICASQIESSASMDTLFASLQHRAFRGEL